MCDDGMVPRRSNGKVDWFGYIRTSWPILAGLLLSGLWVGGRMETPDQKQQRIDRALAPIIAQLEGHIRLGGHSPMEQRMARVETLLEGIAVDIAAIRNDMNGDGP